MLVLLPVFLVLIFTLLTQGIGRSRIALGTKWLILAAVMLVVWGVTLVLHTRLPLGLAINDWLPANGSADGLNFTLNNTSWLISIALLSMAVGIVLTDTSRLGEKGSLAEWTQLLLLTALGLFSALADSALAFLLTWTLIDLVEIVVLTQIHHDEELPIQTLAVFGGRFLGTIFVLLATILAYQNGNPLILAQAGGKIFTLLVLGAAFRLGIVPLHVPYTLDVNLRRSLGSVLRLVAPLSAFVFITRLSVNESISGWLLFVWLFAILGALFGAIKWFASTDELTGRPYWLMSFSSLALIGLLNGKPETAGYLGLVMVIAGCWTFLQSVWVKWFLYLLPVLILSFIGLPFTPSAGLSVNLTVGPASNSFLIVWLSLAFLAAGIVKFTLKSKPEVAFIETWRRFFYISGMVLLILVPWIANVWQFSEWMNLSGLVGGIATVILLGIILTIKYTPRVQLLFTKIMPVFKRIGQLFEKFFHFDWVYRMLSFLFQVLERVLNSVNSILEGEGGILWALVFLVLLISLISSVKGG